MITTIKHPNFEMQGFSGTQEEFLKTFRSPFALNQWIMFAAIMHPDGTIYAVDRPGRHHHCIALMANLGKAGLANTHDQGFVTSAGHYMNRSDALTVATAANQIRIKTQPENRLFSEDIW